MRDVLTAAILAAHLAVSPGPASLQTLFDHLKCHTVRDPLRLEATADLPALQPEFADQGCKVGRAKLFCVPTGKENVAPAPPGPAIIAQPLQEEYVCPRGGGRVRLIATIEDHRVIRKLLAQVGLPTDPPHPRPP